MSNFYERYKNLKKVQVLLKSSVQIPLHNLYEGKFVITCTLFSFLWGETFLKLSTFCVCKMWRERKKDENIKDKNQTKWMKDLSLNAHKKWDNFEMQKQSSRMMGHNLEWLWQSTTINIQLPIFSSVNDI